MEWVLRTEELFWRAKQRRAYVRGKKADREALFRYRLRTHLDKTWGDAMQPFDWSAVLADTKEEALDAGVSFVAGYGLDEGQTKVRP